jgi:ATP-dependent Clp protease, protease subunit
MHVMPCPESTNGNTPSFLDRLLKTRTILVSGAIEEELAERVIASTLLLDSESHDPIRVFLTTPGGMVDVGFAIHDIFKFIEAPIVIISAGFVASMGIPILLSVPEQRRFSLPNTRFMMHQPSGGAGGQAKDIRITAQQIIKTRERLNQLISLETRQPLDKIAADSDRDFWMTADEALQYGLISRIVGRAKEVE